MDRGANLDDFRFDRSSTLQVSMHQHPFLWAIAVGGRAGVGKTLQATVMRND